MKTGFCGSLRNLKKCCCTTKTQNNRKITNDIEQGFTCLTCLTSQTVRMSIFIRAWKMSPLLNHFILIRKWDGPQLSDRKSPSCCCTYQRVHLPQKIELAHLLYCSLHFSWINPVRMRVMLLSSSVEIETPSMFLYTFRMRFFLDHSTRLPESCHYAVNTFTWIALPWPAVRNIGVFGTHHTQQACFLSFFD